jgi:hypothetical protein
MQEQRAFSHMKQLHYRTLMDLRELILAGGPLGERRRLTEVQLFLEGSGASLGEVGTFTSPRQLIDRILRECNSPEIGPYENDLPTMERIILGLVDPREHRGNEQQQSNVLVAVNRALELEDLRVRLDDAGKPTMEYLQPPLTDEFQIHVSIDAEIRFPPSPKFSDATDSTELALDLKRRWVEAEICFSGGAYLASIVLLASILEGVLLSAVNNNPETANRSDSAPRKGGKVKPFREWRLTELLSVASDIGWLSRSWTAYANVLRDSRNYVHPYYKPQGNEWPDKKECRLASIVVEGLIEELLGSPRD